MQQVSNTTLRFGNTKLDRALSPSGNGPNDWSHHISVTFDRPFGSPIQGKPKDVAQAISIVLTPRSFGVPVVAVVESVTATGFKFRVRNANPNLGVDNVSVDWLAVLGVPDANPTLARLIDARLSVLQPKSFSGFLDHRDWPRVWYSEPMSPQRPGSPAVILLTQNDLHCPLDNPASIASVGELENSDQLRADNIIDGVSDYGFAAFASDVDTVGGHCGFYAASFVVSTDPNQQNGGDSVQQLWIDHGSEKHVDSFFKDAIFPGTPYPIGRGGISGDWRTFDIYFDKPFLTPPLVFASARGNTPIVCIARRVTTHGFTLAARNTDFVDGHALFHWIAIGCSEGCG